MLFFAVIRARQAGSLGEHSETRRYVIALGSRDTQAITDEAIRRGYAEGLEHILVAAIGEC